MGWRRVVDGVEGWPDLEIHSLVAGGSVPGVALWRELAGSGSVPGPQPHAYLTTDAQRVLPTSSSQHHRQRACIGIRPCFIGGLSQSAACQSDTHPIQV